MPMPGSYFVEDDRSLLAAMTFAFEADGYRVRRYADAGELLLEPPSTLAADCLIIDYRMPKMDGLSLLAALRRRAIAAPAILITSQPDERCRRRALAAEAEIVEKPLVTDKQNGTKR
jgi:FixJ family two-component response regulator